MDAIKIHLDYNNDNKIDTDDIFDLVFDLMKQQKNNKLLSGNDKKLNVLNLLKVAIGQEAFDRYKPVFDKSIDFIHKKLLKSKCGKKIFSCCR
jgi:hypothetical protein